jgi:hypothetical protein
MYDKDRMLASAAKRKLEKTQADQMRRGAIADKRHAKIAEKSENEDYRYSDQRERDLDRANMPTSSLQRGTEKAPITSKGEGYLFDVETEVYQGDGPFLPAYKGQVLQQRAGATEKDTAAFARANQGLDPTTDTYDVNGRPIRRPAESGYKTYPGHRLFSGEIDNAAPGSQSEWGTRAPLKK